MDNKKNGIPKLRFPGFTGAWEQRKLGEEFKRVNERNNGEFGKDRWISVAKMYFQDPDKVTSNNIDTRTYVMRFGDIAFEGHPNNEFKFGRFVANDIGDGVVSELFPIYRHIRDYDNNYWKYAIHLERIMGPIFAKSITSSGNSSNKLAPKDLLRQSIFLPHLDEQKEIGNFLKKMDSLITLHQRKLEHLQEQKKGLLQKMFPKNGEVVPEVRFPGFTDAWEQRKLGEVGKTFTGLSGKTKEDFGHGDAHFVTYMNVYSNPISDPNMVENVEIDTKQQEVKKGDVFFTTSSETPEEVGMSSVWLSDAPHIYLNSFCFGFRPTVNIFHPYYLAYLLRSNNIRNKMMILAQGISRYNISKNKVMKLNVTIPNIREQQKIGEFFKQLDFLITLHHRKLEKLKQLKKFLLQNMFI